jgi:hypothetical protein
MSLPELLRVVINTISSAEAVTTSGTWAGCAASSNSRDSRSESRRSTRPGGNQHRVAAGTWGAEAAVGRSCGRANVGMRDSGDEFTFVVGDRRYQCPASAAELI